MTEVSVAPIVLVRRREAVTRHAVQQGIDRVEVAPVPGPRGRTRLALTVSFLPADPAVAGKPRRPAGVGPGNVTIRVLDPDGRPTAQAHLRVLAVDAPADPPDAVVVTVEDVDPADPVQHAAVYLLSLTGLPDVDPFFADATFTTDPVRGTEPVLDAVEPLAAAVTAPASAAPPVGAGPVSDYLARDYASFRALMLDRLTRSMPAWQATEPADVVHVVVDLLAHAADQASYYQDAVATEGYLGTARQRVSVRRHARLLDYVLHEGCNARVWTAFAVDGDTPVHLPAGSRLFTRVDGLPVLLGVDDTARALDAGATVFETVHDAVLQPALTSLELYDWGLPDFTLPAGATRAALAGEHPLLAPGAVLLLHAADGAPADGLGQPRVCAVRLTRVDAGSDPLGGTGAGQAITWLEWADADALPVALPVALPTGAAGARARAGRADGNVVLADHGRSLPPEPLPAARPGRETRHRAPLGTGPVSWRETYRDDPTVPAAAMVRQDPTLATPDLQVTGAGATWRTRPDLLASDRRASDVVVEVEDDGSARVRFGDGEYGRAVPPGATLVATYRVGNGAAGNIGRGTLAHLAAFATAELARVTAVANPLPATGGTDPEPVARARLFAPHAFERQRRCAVPQDYVDVAEAHPQVRRAVATVQWSGSWATTVVVVDRVGGLGVDDAFRAELLDWFEPYRLVGVDVDVRGPQIVRVDVRLGIGVAAGRRSDLVELDLAAAFGAGGASRPSPSPSPRRGFFRPEAFAMGEPLYASRMIARAVAVPGVAWADVERLNRRDRPPGGELEGGVLTVGRQEVVRVAPGDVVFALTQAW